MGLGLGSESVLLAYLFAAIISTGVGVFAWLRRAPGPDTPAQSLPGARSFAVVALGEAAWTGAYLIQHLSPTLGSQIFWNNVQFSAVLVTALSYLRFAQNYTATIQTWSSALSYTSRPKEGSLAQVPKIEVRSAIPNIGMPSADRILALSATLLSAWIWTDSIHHLFRTDPHLIAGGPFLSLVYRDGPTFILFTVFTYGLIAYSTFLLTAHLLVSPRIYRLQVATVLVGVLIPWCVSLAAYSGWVPVPLHDITPLTFAPSNLLMLWALFRFHLFEIAPIARDLLVERMREGIIVLDWRNRIVDFNPAAREILALSDTTSLGKLIGHELPALHQFVNHLTQSPNARAEVSLDVLGLPSRFELTATPIYNVLATLSGHLVILRDVTEQRRAEEKLQQLALTDFLTGLLNRRAFFKLAAPEFERSRRYQRPLSFILLDVDNFKIVNGTYGHLVGDQVLAGMARACQYSLRDADKLARYGGEEFVVMLPETDPAGARLAAERMRQIIETVAVNTPQGSVHITASLGVTTYQPAQMQDSLDQLLGQADQALYRAKQTGRNRVWVWQDEEVTVAESFQV